jgi:hypothetical protein
MFYFCIQIIASGLFGTGKGSIGIAGYFIKPGYCPEVSLGEQKGNY